MADVIPVKFIVEEPGKEMVDLRLEQDVVKIGRGARKGIDIQLEDPGVARVHATIQIKAENDVSIVDMGGGGGTFLDGKKIPSKGKLQNASIITVGKTQIRFYIGADALVEGIPAPKVAKAEPELSTEFDIGATLPAQASAAPTGAWQGADSSKSSLSPGGFGPSSPATPADPVAAFGSSPAPAPTLAAPSAPAAPPPLATSFGQAAPSAPSGYPQASPLPSLASVAPPPLASAPQAPRSASPSAGFPATAGPSPARPSPSATSLPAASFGPTSPSGSQNRFPPQASPFGAAAASPFGAATSFGGPQSPQLSPPHVEGTMTFGPLGPPPPPLVSRRSGPSLPILLDVADRLNKETWFVQETP